MTRLARAQERELRSWLFDGIRPGTFDGNPTSLSIALYGIEGEVDVSDFKRFGSARALYHFHHDNASGY